MTAARAKISPYRGGRNGLKDAISEATTAPQMIRLRCEKGNGFRKIGKAPLKP